MHQVTIRAATAVAIGVAALGLLTRPASAGLVEVGVGYADGLRPNPTSAFPAPWRGDPGVHFLGQADSTASFDCGVVCIKNIGTTNVVLDPGIKIDGFQDGSTFQLWDGMIGTGLTIAPGDQAILAQTSMYDFDSSDKTNGTQSSPDNAQPKIHASFDGGATTATYVDSAQVLNTGGYDIAAYINPATGVAYNENLRCRPIGTTGINDPFGTVPEPGSMSLLLGGLPALGLVFRRRK